MADYSHCLRGKHQSAFESLREALINSGFLNFPNLTDIYILDTDASTSTIGATLCQLQNGEEKVNKLASKELSSAQRKYCTTRNELAIVTFTRQIWGLSWPWSYGSWIYNYLWNQCLSPLMLWVRISIRERCTTLCDKICQWLLTGRWFSLGPPVSSTNKTDATI